MTYDFDSLNNRRNTGSLKWNVPEDVLPMWVADMDFKTAPAIRKAMDERISQGIFGYSEPGDEWYQAYINFYRERHHCQLKKEWLVFSLGVVPTISSSVRKLTEVGDNVVVFPPVYNIFYNSIVNNGRVPLEVPLIFDGESYYLDFEGIEKAFSEKKTSLCIFCSPHNPVGRIWSKEELAQLGKIAKKYNVVILSDEIHCELTAPGRSYIPFIEADPDNKDIAVTCIAPTKSFNLAGIQTSAIVIPNPDLRKKVVRQINTDEVAEPNILSCPCAIAALNDSRQWLDELRTYIFGNRKFVGDYISKNIPQIKLISGQATYLLWIDVSRIAKNSKELTDFLLSEAKLLVSTGSSYGKTGDGFIRMNVACPRATVEEGMNRLKNGIEKFIHIKNISK
ncbi:MAG: MalY/PatB family protein [Bacilli bacterium]